MKFKFVLAGFLSILFSALPMANAYDEKRAANNFAHELATCSAYFSTVSEMIGLPENNKVEFSELGFMMFAAASGITNKDSVSARVQMAMREMAAQLDGKSENWSILLNKYDALCKGIAADPETRFNYWRAKS